MNKIYFTTLNFIVFICLSSGCTNVLKLDHPDNIPIEQRSPWSFYDNFTSRSLSYYDQSHIAGEWGFNPVEFKVDENGDTFVALTSRTGLNSHFNRGQKYIKDRVEIGTPYYHGNIRNREIWWGFRVKLPKNVQYNKEQDKAGEKHIMISQIKFIYKGKGVTNHPHFKFNIYPNDDGTYVQVRNKSGKNNFYLEPFKSISALEWTSYKIGIFISDNKKKGWVKFYRNGNLLFNFKGDTFSHDGGIYKHSTVRIGVYRTSGIKGIDKIKEDSDTLHFDDFIVASTEDIIDKKLLKFYKINKLIETKISYEKENQFNKLFKGSGSQKQSPEAKKDYIYAIKVGTLEEYKKFLNKYKNDPSAKFHVRLIKKRIHEFKH
uniref:Uncharacterized protein n=1 Tax=uncultured bacterium EIL80B09 TaxID=1768206 RepID=A0A0U2XU60_9BACT|nr:hypothetical protein [uncultured bacterium EIL80B09]